MAEYDPHCIQTFFDMFLSLIIYSHIPQHVSLWFQTYHMVSILFLFSINFFYVYTFMNTEDTFYIFRFHQKTLAYNA